MQARTVATQEQALVEIEARLKVLKAKTAKLNLELADNQDVLSEVLAGLQRLEQNPPPAIVVQPGDVLQALRSAMMFGAVVPELRGAAETLQAQLVELESLQSQMAEQAIGKQQALAALATSRLDIKQLILAKKSLALSSNKGLEAEKKRAVELAEKAKTLKQLLASLAAERSKAAAEQTAVTKARLEAERRQQEKAAAPAMAFSLAQGQLAYPAQGQILKTFGADNGLGDRLDGIVIATSSTAQVTSPIDGRIEFAGKFRSYGQLLIVNAGEGYLVLLAGMEQILPAAGQSVKAGEPVGVMGQKPAGLAVANGLTNQSTPVLYVEFRKNGDPVDPTPWWAGNRQEATR